MDPPVEIAGRAATASSVGPLARGSTRGITEGNGCAQRRTGQHDQGREAGLPNLGEGSLCDLSIGTVADDDVEITIRSPLKVSSITPGRSSDYPQALSTLAWRRALLAIAGPKLV